MYKKGGSPDIDVLYHKHITLKAAIDYIDKHGRMDAVSTGHYARTTPGDDTHPLASFQGKFLWLIWFINQRALCNHELSVVHRRPVSLASCIGVGICAHLPLAQG